MCRFIKQVLIHEKKKQMGTPLQHQYYTKAWNKHNVKGTGRDWSCL